MPQWSVFVSWCLFVSPLARVAWCGVDSGQAIDGDVKRGKQTMIFCNTVQSCRAVEHSLSEHDIPSLSYHGDMPKEARSDSFAEFLAHAPVRKSRSDAVLAGLVM